MVRPSLAALHVNHPSGYAESFRHMQDDPLLDEFFDLVENSKEGHIAKLAATFDVAAAMTVFGICLADLTPKDCSITASRAGRACSAGRHGLPGRQAWHFLHLMGHFPATVPTMMRAAVYRGPRSVAEMVDRHQISNTEVRDLLVDYITRRSADIDYTTTDALAQGLAGLFWATIEKINPVQRDLRLSQATYEQWKAESQSCPTGGPGRTSRPCSWRSAPSTSTCKAGRSPSRNGGHAGPYPARSVTASSAVTAADAAASLSAWPTGPASASRSCPCSPSTSTSSTEILKACSPRRWRQLPVRSSSTRAAPTGAPTAGTTRTGRKRKGRGRPGSSTRPPAACSTSPSKKTARSGSGRSWKPCGTPACRIEELCELTHLSIRQYRRPNGEVAALLVIAPSKTDRERVIPMSAELFAVIAAIIRRHLQAPASDPAPAAL